MQSGAKTVDEYLAELPDDRRESIEAVRSVILKKLPNGYEEGMQYGMIGYFIPLKRYPDTYNGEALCLASLASQKHHMAVYLMNVYGNPDVERWFMEEYKKSGKKLDMGKSCVRFKKLEDLPLELIGETIAKTSPEQYIAYYEAARKKK